MQYYVHIPDMMGGGNEGEWHTNHISIHFEIENKNQSSNGNVSIFVGFFFAVTAAAQHT